MGLGFLFITVYAVIPLPDEWQFNYGYHCGLGGYKIVTLQYKCFMFLSLSAIYLYVAYIGTLI